ncbi:MAG TPA: hypothetical protein VID47_17460 [Actinomycetota bacterium]|jgi:hypothetical protein
MDRPTRRNAIRRGLLSLGGLVGLGATARTAGRGTGPLHLVAPDLLAHAVRQPAGPGQASAARFGLLDDRGRAAGEVHVATVRVLGPGMSSTNAGAMEWHTFHLPGGTILGAGSSGTESGTFAVVGGTGRYANARGTYELRRDVVGGEGAEFVLRLEP